MGETRQHDLTGGRVRDVAMLPKQGGAPRANDPPWRQLDAGLAPPFRAGPNTDITVRIPRLGLRRGVDRRTDVVGRPPSHADA